MSQIAYRCYRLDGVGHLQNAEWFEAASDDAAISLAEVKYPEALCEIWQGGRLVAKVSPKRLQA